MNNKINGCGLAVLRHSLCNLVTNQFFYSDNTAAIIEDLPINGQSENNR